MGTKKKKSSGILLVAGLIAFILAIRFIPSDQPEPVDRLPGLDDSYRDHAFLYARDNGDSFELEGNVMITFLMVDDPDTAWTAEAMEDFKLRAEEAGSKLEQEAQRHGVALRLQHRFIPCQIQQTFDKEARDPWVEAALTQAGYTRSNATRSVKEESQVDQAPFFLCINEKNRSFACQSSAFEYGVLYFNGADYRHELLHLFGAVDFYYPQEATDLAQQYFADSIMLGGSEEPQVDEMTAYLVGWTDTPSASTQSFLDQTSHVTQAYVSEEHKQEVFTGYKSDRYGDGTYTGDWVEGVPYGNGKMEYDEGHVYEGQFVYGEKEGQGTYIWSNGDVYEGQWVEGTMHGQGTITWHSGDRYSGAWLQGHRTGYGTYTWSSGAKYEGQWVDGKIEGQGTMRYASGYVESGIWSDGELVG